MSASVAVASVEDAWRAHSRRVLATLIRLLGDFDLAEEALHDAFVVASERWPDEGMPVNPVAWLVSAGRFKAIDKLRRRARFDTLAPELTLRMDQEHGEMDEQSLADDQLRLIFTCCHPLLVPEARVALTLRAVCGLTTEEIARAFLVRPPTLAQRIVRAKARIRAEKIPYIVPERDELAVRLDAVLHVVYLVFNEGYSAHSGETLTRADLSGEAIRLGRLIADLLPDGEALGLLALMLIHESRRGARSTLDGDIVLLPDQDRTRWDRRLIGEGAALVEKAFATGEIGPYAVQAAIAAVHAEAATAEMTDWGRIVALYDVLLRAAPSPVVELNRAVALGMDRGPAEGLAIIEELFASGQLLDYHPAFAAEADLARRLGDGQRAAKAYARALELCRQEPERRFLQGRLDETKAIASGPG
ncbi:MAG: RNA polymerase sigma factor [Oricola sp.]